MTGFTHVVLFDAPDLGDADDVRFAAEAAAFAELDGIHSSIGDRLARGHENGYTHMLVMEVADEPAFARYVADSRHEAFVEWVLPGARVAAYDIPHREE